MGYLTMDSHQVNLVQNPEWQVVDSRGKVVAKCLSYEDATNLQDLLCGVERKRSGYGPNPLCVNCEVEMMNSGGGVHSCIYCKYSTLSTNDRSIPKLQSRVKTLERELAKLEAILEGAKQ